MNNIYHQPLPTDEKCIATQAATWFTRMRSESISPAERLQFRVWYQANSAHRKAYDETEALWNDTSFVEVLSAFELSASHPRSPIRINRFIKPALALAACLAVVTIIYRPTLACWQADYCTSVGEINTVVLADGSQVTLNSGSALSVNFKDGIRQTHLKQGEVFFEIQPDPQHPFIVDAQYSSTQVLGTRFVVKEDNSSDSITVISGVVEVYREKLTPAILKVNDSIIVDNDHNSEIREVSTTNAVAWIKGKAVFDNAALSDVIAEIGRYRRGNLLIKNKTLKNLKVSGRFDISDTDKALAALQQTLPIKIYRFSPWLVLIG
jgi:transmembrane sensor